MRVRRHGGKAGDQVGPRGHVLDRQHIAAKGGEPGGLIGARDDEARAGEIEAVPPLGFGLVRVQRGFRRANQTHRQRGPDGGDAVGQGAGDRMAGPHAVLAQHTGKAGGASGEFGIGDGGARAVPHGDARAELGGAGSHVAAPGNRVEHQPSATIGLRSTPMPVTSTSTVSPGFIHSGGLR
jgi:hypothetical protein